MNGPGRKSLRRRVQELEERTPRKGGGKMILFEWEIPPGETPKPWFGVDGRPRPPIVIKLDTRPVEIPPEDLIFSESDLPAQSRPEESLPWCAFALEGEEIN